MKCKVSQGYRPNKKGAYSSFAESKREAWLAGMCRLSFIGTSVREWEVRQEIEEHGERQARDEHGGHGTK